MSRQSRLAKIADNIAIEIVYDAALLDVDKLHKELLDCNYDVHEIMLIARERLIEHVLTMSMYMRAYTMTTLCSGLEHES